MVGKWEILARQLALPELEPYGEDLVSAVWTEPAAAVAAAAAVAVAGAGAVAAKSNSRSLSVTVETEPVLVAVSPAADRVSTDA